MQSRQFPLTQGIIANKWQISEEAKRLTPLLAMPLSLTWLKHKINFRGYRTVKLEAIIQSEFCPRSSQQAAQHFQIEPILLY